MCPPETKKKEEGMKMQNGFESNTKKKGGEKMKKMLLVVAALVLVASSAMAASIKNTKHDFQANAYGATAGTEICVYCHTPHGANTVAPLWNKASGSASGAYTSDTFDAANAAWAANVKVGKACLSCHDGTTGTISAVNNFGSKVGTQGLASGNALLGTLENDHPIGISYADGGTGLNVAPVGVVFFSGVNKATAPVADIVDCATCHNVHDNANTYFLRVSNNGSALCLLCHNK